MVRITPEVLNAPYYPVSRLFQLLFGFVNFACWLTLLALNALLLPVQIARFASAHTLSALLLLSLFSVLSILLISPLAGALSDRTTSRFGRRRPWLLAGALLVSVTLLLIEHVTSFLPLLFECTLFHIGITIMLVNLSAVIPDQTPAKQYATVAAIAGLAQPTGALIGLLLLTGRPQTLSDVYAILISILLVSVSLFLPFLREKFLPPGIMPALEWRRLFIICWAEPLRSPYFGWAWLTRLLICLSYFMLPCSLPYLLAATQATHLFSLPEPIGVVSTTGLFIFLSLTILLTTSISGILSDRWQQRKAFVIVGGLLIVSASLMLLGHNAGSASASVIYVVYANMVLGSGYGAYLSTNLALTMQVLPSRATHGRDMGQFNIAALFPPVLGPGCAALLMAIFHSSTALFLLAALFALAGTLLLRYLPGN